MFKLLPTSLRINTYLELRYKKKIILFISYDFFQTSNGTMVGNENLVEFEERQLNNLDLIVLANDDEGVILQFINKVDQTIDLSNFDVSFTIFYLFFVFCYKQHIYFQNNQSNYKRKIMCKENLDESTAVKVPKLGKFSPYAFT